MQLIVIGMHRSGTSVLARLLNLMGAYFAPEGMGTGANQENPKGFWERRDVRALNDFVLHGTGCDWDRISNFDVSTVSAPLREEFEKRASQIVLSMDGYRPWFMKEPRLCLLLPLWLRVLEAPVCIHVLRHPVEVASSLHTRNRIPIEAGLALWEIYNASAIRAMKGLPRIVVNHRDLMLQPVATVEALHSQLAALGVHRMTLPAASEIASFISSDLYRERQAEGGLEACSGMPRIQLFEQWSAGRALPEDVHDPAEIERDALIAYEASLPPLKAPIDSVLHERAVEKRNDHALEREKRIVSALDEIRATLDAERDVLQKQLDERFEELARLTRLYMGLNEELMHANLRIREREASLKELQAENDGLNAELRSLRDGAELRKKAISHMSAEISRSNDALSSVIGSASWRMTRFLRALGAGEGSRGEPSPSDRELIGNSGLFDGEWYLASYPEVVETGLDPLTHFLVVGAGQKFNPGPDFNLTAYLRKNRDVEKSGDNPLIHYLRHGMAEGRHVTKVGSGDA